MRLNSIDVTDEQKKLLLSLIEKELNEKNSVAGDLVELLEDTPPESKMIFGEALDCINYKIGQLFNLRKQLSKIISVGDTFRLKPEYMKFNSVVYGILVVDEMHTTDIKTVTKVSEYSFCSEDGFWYNSRMVDFVPNENKFKMRTTYLCSNTHKKPLEKDEIVYVICNKDSLFPTVVPEKFHIPGKTISDYRDEGLYLYLVHRDDLEPVN